MKTEYQFSNGEGFIVNYNNGEIHIDEWSEQDHPRGNNGRFVSKNGEISDSDKKSVERSLDDWCERITDKHFNKKYTPKAWKQTYEKTMKEAEEIGNEIIDEFAEESEYGKNERKILKEILDSKLAELDEKLCNIKDYGTTTPTAKQMYD